MISSEDYNKGATYDTSPEAQQEGRADEDYEKPKIDNVGASEHERCSVYEFDGEKEDFASAFVPSGFRVISVSDEDDVPCRLLFQR